MKKFLVIVLILAVVGGLLAAGDVKLAAVWKARHEPKFTEAVAFDTVDRCVAERYGIDPEQLKQHGRRAGMAKAVAVELSCMATGESARTVRLHYGGISCSAVGNIRRKVREGQLDIRFDLAPLLPRIRTTHVENTANGPKVSSSKFS